MSEPMGPDLQNDPGAARWMERLEEAARAQERCARRQTRLMAAACAACVGVLLLVGGVWLRMQPILTKLDQAADGLTSVTSQLDQVDLVQTVDGLNQTMASAQRSLTTGAEKIDQLDVEGLNDAIEKLTKVIEPLSRLFGGK